MTDNDSIDNKNPTNENSDPRIKEKRLTTSGLYLIFMGFIFNKLITTSGISENLSGGNLLIAFGTLILFTGVFVFIHYLITISRAPNTTTTDNFNSIQNIRLAIDEIRGCINDVLNIKLLTDLITIIIFTLAIEFIIANRSEITFALMSALAEYQEYAQLINIFIVFIITIIFSFLFGTLPIIASILIFKILVVVSGYVTMLHLKIKLTREYLKLKDNISKSQTTP